MRGLRPLLIITLAVVATVIAFVVYRTAQTTPGYNVLLITLDTTRVDHLGCYGYSSPVSPRIDAMAASGVLFENAYTTASVTPVSHASILTGENPYTHGLRVMHGLHENRLPESAVTLAEILKEGGYTTAAFVSAFPAGSRFGLQQGFDVFNEAFLKQPADEIIGPDGMVNTGENQRRADETTDLALDWLQSAPESFFLWLHYFDPHDIQVMPPTEFLNQFPPPTGTEAEQLIHVYDIEIQYMDQQIGRVFDALEAAGRMDDTIVVIVSDHGQGLGDHDWWTHGLLYEEQIKAPLIIRAPGMTAGRRVKHVVRAIDVAPTILDLVGFADEQPPSTDGYSLVPMLQGEIPDPRYVAYADSVNISNYQAEVGTIEEKSDMLFAVLDGRWKFIQHILNPEESELYDLKEDPRESTNLRDDRPVELERLRQNLWARPIQPETGEAADDLSDEDRERLRSLGYGE